MSRPQSNRTASVREELATHALAPFGLDRAYRIGRQRHLARTAAPSRRRRLWRTMVMRSGFILRMKRAEQGGSPSRHLKIFNTPSRLE
jgi:hypothetical protein